MFQFHMANTLLFCIALIVLVVAGVYYRVYHGCDLGKEHDDITCHDVFLLSIFIYLRNVMFTELTLPVSL